VTPEGVHRSGHRLEADDRLIGRRVDLRVREAGRHLDRRAPASGGDAEAARAGKREQVVVRPPAELERLARALAALPGRQPEGVERQLRAHGQLDDPLLAGRAGRRQVRVEAERQRNRRRRPGDDRRRDRQPSRAEVDGELEPVGEREHREQIRVRPEVELGQQPALAGVAHRPVRSRRERAVDRQAMRVAVQER
jgi:hypothetical protein